MTILGGGDSVFWKLTRYNQQGFRSVMFVSTNPKDLVCQIRRVNSLVQSRGRRRWSLFPHVPTVLEIFFVMSDPGFPGLLVN